jgi:hypothetical protein
MSALFPSDTKLDTPVPIRATWSSAAMPTAPDCEATARPPGAGRTGANVAASRTLGSVFSIPRQFGPTSRTISRMECPPVAKLSRMPGSATKRLDPALEPDRERLTQPQVYAIHVLSTVGPARRYRLVHRQTRRSR